MSKEKAQWLRTFVVLIKDPSLVLKISGSLQPTITPALGYPTPVFGLDRHTKVAYKRWYIYMK